MKNLVIFFKAMSCETRINILQYLLEKDKASISELAFEINKDQSTVFRHVKKLERAGIIKSTKQNKFLLCCISKKKKFKRMFKMLRECIEECE